MNKIFNKRNSLIFLIVWLIVIFVFSNMSGSLSSGLSKNIVLSITYKSSIDKNTFDLIHLLVRKFAHFIEYFVLAALSFSYFRFSKKENSLYITVYGFCLICSILDEFHQIFIGGRTGKIGDVLIDSAGIILFLIIIILYKSNAAKRKSD